MKLYLSYITIYIRSILSYKASFILTLIGQLIISFTTFLSIYFMYLRFPVVKGYTYPQVLLCFSIVMMQFSLSEVFGRGFDTFSSMISNGEFDRILVRPRNEVYQVLASKFELQRMGKVIQGIIMLVYAIFHINVSWTLGKILTVVLMVFGGMCIFTGLFIVYAALCFFTTQGLEFMNIFTDGAKEYGKYPFDLYGKKIMAFVTFIIPYALTQYYPLMYLYGKSERAWYMLLPLCGVVFLIPCYKFFKFGVTHYRSTGS